MQRKRMNADTCPIARSLDDIGDWWSLLIVRNALAGASRFSEFQKQLGISKNILTARLSKMVEDGIFEMVPGSEGAKHLQYRLTPKGQKLRIVLLALRQWGEEHLFEHGEEMSVLVDRDQRKPLSRLKVISNDGRELQESQTVLVAGTKA